MSETYEQKLAVAPYGEAFPLSNGMVVFDDGSEVPFPINKFNVHLTEWCNMGCKYCIATYADATEVNESSYLPREQGLLLARQLGRMPADFNIAGGEPLAAPWAGDFVKTLREVRGPDAQLSLVTNGSLILKKGIKALKQFELDGVNQLNKIAVSIDTGRPAVASVIGRKTGGKAFGYKDYVEMSKIIADSGIEHFKINIVVSNANWQEYFGNLLSDLDDEKEIEYVKFIQAFLRGDQQPLAMGAPFIATARQFNHFAKRNGVLPNRKNIRLVFERAEDTETSYVMINPWGRFYWVNPDSPTKAYRYGRPILRDGIQAAYAELAPHLSRDAFLFRGGDHSQWNQMFTSGVVTEEAPNTPEDRTLTRANVAARLIIAGLAEGTDGRVQHAQQQARGNLRQLKHYAPLLDPGKHQDLQDLEEIAQQHPKSIAGVYLQALRRAVQEDFAERLGDSEMKNLGEVQRFLAGLGLVRADT